MKNKCWYISSKMSGLPNYNFDGFKKKKLELLYKEKLYGYERPFEIWNPAEHEPNKTNAMWSEYLAQDIIDIEENCTDIYMFGKWYKSQGAIIEMLTAHRLGLDVIIENKWLRWVPIVLDLMFDVSGNSKSTLTEG